MDKANLKRVIFLIVVIAFLLIVAFIINRYQRVGETNLPFSIKKILIVSTIDTEKVEDPENLWNIPIDQVNDIYVYIEKNGEEDNKTTLKSIKFDNIKIENGPSKGEVQLLKATGDINTANLYTNSSENFLDQGLSFVGSDIDDMKSLEIANVGGVCGYRMLVKNVGTYISTDGEEVIYDGSLLSKIGVKKEDISFKVSADVIITTDKDINFKGTITYELPVGNIIEEGKGTTEITDFSDVIFKRV